MRNLHKCSSCHVTSSGKFYERELLIPSVKKLLMCCRIVSLDPSGLFIDEQNYEVNGEKVNEKAKEINQEVLVLIGIREYQPSQGHVAYSVFQKQLCHFFCCSWRIQGGWWREKKMSLHVSAGQQLVTHFAQTWGCPWGHQLSGFCSAHHTHSVSSLTKACVLLLAKAFNCVYTKFKRSH